MQLNPIRTLAIAIITCVLPAMPAPAQAPKPSPQSVERGALEPPDAGRTRDELMRLMDRYPPNLRNVLALDSGLLTNQSYLSTYPELAAFLGGHPEVAHNPSFYLGEGPQPRPDAAARVFDLWQAVLGGLAAFTAFGMAIALLVWLIRTFIDYRRWNRLTKVQTDVHTKLLDRFASNEELIAYIQSPAGSKFLESTPINLDPGPRSVGAPLGRILWSIQGGLVLACAGIGFQVVSSKASAEAAEGLHALGIIAISLGIGFLASAIISYVISRRLGLIEQPPANHRRALNVE